MKQAKKQGTKQVAINGFGRIGRNVVRALVESPRDDFRIVAINDLAPAETAALLLELDPLSISRVWLAYLPIQYRRIGRPLCLDRPTHLFLDLRPFET